MKLQFVSKSAKKHIKKIYLNHKAIIEECEKSFIYAVTPKDKMFPKQLLEVQPPIDILYIRDNHKLLKKKSISVVGARKSSNHGDILTKKITKFLVKKKFVVVSGGADGIDTAAQEGVKLNNGSFILVRPSLLNIPRTLATKMDICVISENHPLYKFQVKDLMLRNRIQAGLSKASVTVEFSTTKGTERHVEYAKKQNKPIFILNEPNLNKQNLTIAKKFKITPVTYHELKEKIKEL